MPKINFNVPFINELGEPITQIKTDPKKLKIQPNGQALPEVQLDENGNAQQEPIMVKDLVARILNMNHVGDESVAFDDKVKRGKLARKIQAVGTQNYPAEEIAIIRDLSARAGTTVLIAQLDDLLAGENDTGAA